MIARVWWFVSGALFGGVVAVRALRRKPTSAEVRNAALATGADALDLGARVIRPKRTR